MTVPCPLTEKELQVVRRLAGGIIRKDLAAEFQVSTVAICQWVTAICQKAGVKRRDTVLVATAIRNG